jgi:hypothetical protein
MQLRTLLAFAPYTSFPQFSMGDFLITFNIYKAPLKFVFAVSGKRSVPSQLVANRGPQQQQPRYRQQQPQSLEVESPSPEEPVPSYMRSTSASIKKEQRRPVSVASMHVMSSTPRRKSSFGQTQSQLDLRTVVSDDDSSSEENLKRSNIRRRSSSHDRR